MDGPNRSKRMTTNIERVFRHEQNGFYREIFLHYLNFLDVDGKVISSKLDKTIPKGLYRLAESDQQRSMHGEVLYQFPGEEEPVRMLAVGLDEGDFRYGRF